MSDVESPVLSVAQAAVYLGVSRATVYRITAEQGRGPSGLQPLLIRGRRVFLRADLDAYLQRCKVAPTRHCRGATSP